MCSANLIQVKAGEIRGLFEIGVPEEMVSVSGGRGTLGRATSQHRHLHGGTVQGWLQRKTQQGKQHQGDGQR